MSVTLSFTVDNEVNVYYGMDLRNALLVGLSTNKEMTMNVAGIKEPKLGTADDFWLFCLRNSEYMRNVTSIGFDKRIHESKIITYFHGKLDENKIAYECSNQQQASFILCKDGITHPIPKGYKYFADVMNAKK